MGFPTLYPLNLSQGTFLYPLSISSKDIIGALIIHLFEQTVMLFLLCAPSLGWSYFSTTLSFRKDQRRHQTVDIFTSEALWNCLSRQTDSPELKTRPAAAGAPAADAQALARRDGARAQIQKGKRRRRCRFCSVLTWECWIDSSATGDYSHHLHLVEVDCFGFQFQPFLF